MFKCNSCGKMYKKEPFGECSACGAFQDFVEVSESVIPSRSQASSSASSSHSTSQLSVSDFTAPTRLSDVKPESAHSRIKTGYSECDRVLGGGFVRGEVVLLSGQPGAGKSTLCLGIANNISNNNVHNASNKNAKASNKVVYVSGEESVEQIALRGRRMGVSGDDIIISHETRAESVIAYCEEYKPVVCIVDSVQTLTVSNVSSAAGSIAQSKAVADMLTLYGKRSGVVMILISQIVKSGDFSGSESIQHIVDATLKIDLDKMSPLRFLRAVKNRFGATDEVGVFQHVDNGLEEITDPTKIALDDDSVQGTSGTAISMLSEGARFFPIEVQSLAIPSALHNPRKQFTGVNSGKAHGICAIIDKFCKTELSEQDIYINTVSNINIDSPSCDLGVAASLITSFRTLDMPTGFCYIGEISLTGAIRNTSVAVKAASEAYRLGYTNIVLPASAKTEVLKSLKKQGSDLSDVKVYPVRTIIDLNKVISERGTKNTDEQDLRKMLKKESNAQKYAKSMKKRTDVTT